MEKTFDTPGPLGLRIDVPAGEIQLSAQPGVTQTRVEVVGLDDEAERLLDEVRVELRESRGGHEVVVEVPKRKGWRSFIGFDRGGFRVSLTCPEEALVTVRTASADVHGRGRFGPVDVVSASGEVSFDDVAGEATVKTASGDIELGTVDGRANAHSASGDVTIRSVGGSVGVNTVSGDIHVRDARGDVSTNSVSGDQRLEAVSAGVVNAKAVSGDIVVGVRRGAHVFLDCNTLSGDTRSELDPSGEPGEEGPLVELRAKTVSGDITVVRAAAIPEEVRS